jgi:lipopolysaccharide transport system ATP-binding protein
MTTVIQAEGLSKKYRIAHQRAPRNDMLREALVNFVRGLGNRAPAAEVEDFWALKDISFEVGKGDRVGIIGRNGAGKSTLLKIFSRITEPTAGRVTLHGRVASLLEVGTGFHPELSGRENIYLNGAVLGMRREEIRRKFDEIVAFAEVEKFLDTPVKRYSSGMYVRLAFAVAAHLNPDILVVDEVLAVGDAAFQKKCLARMDKAAQEGTTILFVSHNVAAVQSLCRSAILLEGGRLIAQGEVGPVINSYLESTQRMAAMPLDQRHDRSGSGAVRFMSFEARNESGATISACHSGQNVVLAVQFAQAAPLPLNNVVFGVVILNELGAIMAYFSNELVSGPFALPGSADGFSVEIEGLPLLPGEYQIDLYCSVNGVSADTVHGAASLMVESGDFYGTGRLPPIPNQGCLLVRHGFHLHLPRSATG